MPKGISNAMDGSEDYLFGQNEEEIKGKL